MKKFSTAIFMISAMIFMSSCSDEIFDEVTEDEGSVLKLNVEMPCTRGVVDGSDFSEGDAIGLFITKASGEVYSATKNCDNIKAVYNKGRWVLEENFILDENEGVVTAYYPYDPDLKVVDGSIDIDVTPDPKTGQDDFMHGKSINSVNKDNLTANIRFKHSLARITLAVTKGANDVGEGVISKIVLNNNYVGIGPVGSVGGYFGVNGKLDLNTGKTVLNYDKEAGIVIIDEYRINEKEATLINILIFPFKNLDTKLSVGPVIDDNRRAYIYRTLVTLTIDGSDYSFLLDNYQAKPGEQFTYPITIDRQTNPNDVETFDSPANSYIVSKSGKYKFLATRGNSYIHVGNVASAEVLWESFGTDVAPHKGDLISSVSCFGDFIQFSTSEDFKEGNAVIAAKDPLGNILWSWHIWLTDKPEDQVYNNNAGTMMDRNLGATSATPGDVGALGLLYQWGRKDPFLGSSSISSNNHAKSTLNSWPITSSSVSTGTISYAISHPTTFIKLNDKNADWYYTDDMKTDNTRWQSIKTIYDPCPVGYRIPDGGKTGIWSTAFGTSSSFFNSTSEGFNFGKSDTNRYLTEETACWYPAAGYLGGSDGSLGSVGSIGSYWSCSPSGIEYSIYYLTFNIRGNVNPSGLSLQASGRSVRCQKE